ncbi:MAG TPA: GrpB family protein [Candidatus Baltobacteraceae bacterium]|nr:GrpB family protein [Candidatus Baltobacteraceae bacterium]
MIAIELSEYDPRWPRFFEEHQKRIAAALHGRRTRIDHIGSTSVPGLAAKPVIDILVQGASYDDRDVRSALQSAGYELAVDEPGHRMFASADRAAHVHLWADSTDSERHIRFRDWLRTHPEDCELYAHVKRELAQRTWETRDHYADAKTPVIRAILRRAGGEALGPRTARFANLLLERLRQHARVLEIGAGEGLLAKRLTGAGHDVVALDTQLRSTFPIVETAFENYAAPPRSFDCIAAQLVLHHVADLNAALEKIGVLLKPAGIVAIDDYGWERSTDEAFRRERSELHTSRAMLAALGAHFEQTYYVDHAYFNDGAGDDTLAFTFIGKPR